MQRQHIATVRGVAKLSHKLKKVKDKKAVKKERFNRNQTEVTRTRLRVSCENFRIARDRV